MTKYQQYGKPGWTPRSGQVSALLQNRRASLVRKGLAVAAFCVGVGWFFIRYDIQNRITHYLNANANPQINQIQDDLNAIKKRLEIE
jgi:hypothetical protein